MTAKASPLTLTESEAAWPATLKVVPVGCQTFSRGPKQHVNGVSPKYTVRSKGCRTWDRDGNEYIDYMMGLGPITLGHADDVVNAAVKDAIDDGVCPSLPHPLETEVANLLVEAIPCAEMVRFGKNGSDVTSAAVRVARGYTGRMKVARCGYHGWQDWAIGTTTRNLGVPEAISSLTLTFDYNDIDSLRQLFEAHSGEIAAVIMEPVTFDPPRDDFLNKVADLTRANGALLIFDEVITGFRAATGGAQEMFGVTPDLASVGKGMGNGFPISAVVGRADVMELFEEVFFSFTFGGETASLAAARATIQEIRKRDTISHIHAMGQRIIDGYRRLIETLDIGHITHITGYPYWPDYAFHDVPGAKPLEIQSLFQQEIVRRGILTRAAMFICDAHKEEDIDRTLGVFAEALEVVKSAVEKGCVLEWLDGDVIEPVIRARK